MYNLSWLQKAADEYSCALQSFLAFNPEVGLFIQQGSPVDHCAVKLKDSLDYEVFTDAFLPVCEFVSCLTTHQRRLGVVTLFQPVTIGSFGFTNSLEIMEPKPEKVGKDFVGFEHVEFVVSDLLKCKSFLERGGIAIEFNDNDGHKAIVVKISEAGQEVKLTNTPILNVLKKQQGEGDFVITKGFL